MSFINDFGRKVDNKINNNSTKGGIRLGLTARPKKNKKRKFKRYAAY